ncbi:acylneuraminate cytidylyltransferase family protein, partial [Candidatus Pacearchaeota archaeon]|nr:acylneuraminate cytidylyltransferase family protein [Candidatus Pacearchaeota archaeon]
MTETVAFIPIKSLSKRLSGKNFKSFCGHPLYKYIITSTVESRAFDEIYVDTDSDEIKDFAESVGSRVIDRPEHMTADSVNGNDLLIYDYEATKKGDFLFQLFATAPLLKSETIRKCVDFLKNN